MCLWGSLFVFIFSFGFISGNLFHFLSLLLVFELLAMSSFLLLSFFVESSYSDFGCYLGVVFLGFCVIEAVVGLSLLVSCSRSAGASVVKLYSFMGV
uniref:NADH dehydrogenase subunit 4L n=1 Tax=Raeta pulchella TaxID=2109557 RepID=A0AA49X753_9BIVA|nr:NADH dehydrogenase subunit 4L [Raeta pulchella]WLK25951.1 NADH dehydrogenase subunit 4L [Raeta pulchella]